MRRGLSLRWRFLAAFGVTSGFAVIAAFGGLSAVGLIGDTLDAVVEEGAPAIADALDLATHVERVVTAAPTLLVASDAEEARAISTDIEMNLDLANELLMGLSGRELIGESGAEIASLVERLRTNLNEIYVTIEMRQELVDRKARRLRELQVTSSVIRRNLAQSVVADHAHRFQLFETEPDRQIVDGFLAGREAEYSRVALKDALLLSARAATATELDLLAFQLQRSLRQFLDAVSQVDQALSVDLTPSVQVLDDLARGSDSIPMIRRQELVLTDRAARYLGENTVLAGNLRNVVEELVGRAREQIANARDNAQDVRQAAGLMLFAIAGISVAASVVIVWRYVDGNLLRRLSSLSDSMRAVADGNLRIAIHRSGSDEIADMADALKLFRDTAIEIEERNLRRADEFLNVILPPEAAEELKRTGAVQARTFSDVVVVFCDIVGFTSYCEHRAAEEIVSALDLFARRSEEIIREEGLEKIKTVGDGLMLTCNLFRRHDDPVMAAIRCVTRLGEAAKEAPLDWRLRSGVHIGTIVGGLIGRDKFTFDIWGDPVNVASRLSDLGMAEICMSEAAWRGLSGRLDCRRVTAIPIKGLGPMDVYIPK